MSTQLSGLAHVAVPFALSLCLALGCSDEASGGSDGAVDLGEVDLARPDQGTPDGVGTLDTIPQLDEGSATPVLDKNHVGWAKTECASCHGLPPSVQQRDHSAFTESWQCASCHGANGACDANGANSNKKDHLPSNDCLSCHAGAGHGYTAMNQCASCHLASAGMVDCP